MYKHSDLRCIAPSQTQYPRAPNHSRVISSSRVTCTRPRVTSSRAVCDLCPCRAVSDVDSRGGHRAVAGVLLRVRPGVQRRVPDVPEPGRVVLGHTDGHHRLADALPGGPAGGRHRRPA